MNEPQTAAAPPPAIRPLDRGASLLAPSIDSLGASGTLITPLIVVFALAVATAGATWGWASNAPPGTGADLLRSSGGLVWILALVTPVSAALKGLLFAFLAWALLVLMGGTPRLRPLISTFYYGEVILTLQALWVTGVALLLSLPPSSEPGALPVPTGLDALIPPGHISLLAVAQQVTPFYLGWVIFLALALAAHGGVSRIRGASAAFILWGMGAGLAVLRSLSL